MQASGVVFLNEVGKALAPVNSLRGGSGVFRKSRLLTYSCSPIMNQPPEAEEKWGAELQNAPRIESRGMATD